MCVVPRCTHDCVAHLYACVCGVHVHIYLCVFVCVNVWCLHAYVYMCMGCSCAHMPLCRCVCVYMHMCICVWRMSVNCRGSKFPWQPSNWFVETGSPISMEPVWVGRLTIEPQGSTCVSFPGLGTGVWGYDECTPPCPDSFCADSGFELRFFYLQFAWQAFS